MTSSEMLELGTVAPEFDLPDPSGKRFSFKSLGSPKGYLIAFICNHCPYVRHIREELAALGGWCEQKNVAMVAINSNDFEQYPDDSPERMVVEARTYGYTFPYLVDEAQTVAKAYRAACTPDFYVFDGERRLVYRGQLDSSRPGNEVPVTGEDVRAAIEALVVGQPVAETQTPSIGCNIKWKPGNAPAWFG